MHTPIKFLSYGIVLLLLFANPAHAGCPIGDVHQDADCQVNWLDVRDFAEHWLDASCMAPDCEADLDGIPGVNNGDYAKLARNWLAKGTISLAINEFMARNTHTLRDPDDPSGSFDDWLEIHNYGPDAIDVGGFYLSDDMTDTGGWRIPDNVSQLTTIAAGGYLLIWADGETGQGPLHADFSLAAGGGEDVALFDAGHQLIDSISFGPQNPDESYGRLPNGTGPWRFFTMATPGSENVADSVRIVINEIMYHPAHAELEPENLGLEYIELFNAGTGPVDGGFRTMYRNSLLLRPEAIC